MTQRVAVLISGGGSNMVSLVTSMTGDHPARPVLVLSNRPAAGGLLLGLMAQHQVAGVFWPAQIQITVL